MSEEKNIPTQETNEGQESAPKAPKKVIKKKPPRPVDKPKPKKPKQAKEGAPKQVPKKKPKKEAEKPTKKKPRRKINTAKISHIMALLVVLLAFYLGLSLFVGGLILYSFYDTADNTEIYSLSVVFDEKKIFSMDAEEANNEYGLYVPFSQLAEIGAFGLAGDGENFSMFIIGTDNRIEGTINSSLVVINDNPIRIASPIVYDAENGEYMIPIVLIENYINGIDVTYNDEKMICTVSADINKTDVALKLLLPKGMENAYFPDSFKYYGDEMPENSENPTE